LSHGEWQDTRDGLKLVCATSTSTESRVSKQSNVFFSLLVVGAMSGCGGGGGDTATATSATAEGTYSGAITNDTVAAAFDAIVLEDGQIWTLYGNVVGGTLEVLGLLEGQGTSSNGSFTSTTIKDFGASPAIAASMTATYVPSTSIAGTITAPAGSLGFNGTAIPASVFNYATPASLSNIVGAWTLASTSGNSIAINVAANGTFTGQSNGSCTLSGLMVPRPSGKNVFNVQLTIGPAPCSLPGFLGGGIALYLPLANGTHQLIFAVVDASRSVGTAAFGTR
jgi:hypothetical protein